MAPKITLLLSLLAITISCSTAVSSSPIPLPVHPGAEQQEAVVSVRVQAPSLLNTKPDPDQAALNQYDSSQTQQPRRYVRLDDVTEQVDRGKEENAFLVAPRYEDYFKALQGIIEDTGVYEEPESVDVVTRLRREGGDVVRGWGRWVLERFGRGKVVLEGVWRTTVAAAGREEEEEEGEEGRGVGEQDDGARQEDL